MIGATFNIPDFFQNDTMFCVLLYENHTTALRTGRAVG